MSVSHAMADRLWRSRSRYHAELKARMLIKGRLSNNAPALGIRRDISDTARMIATGVRSG